MNILEYCEWKQDVMGGWFVKHEDYTWHPFGGDKPTLDMNFFFQYVVPKLRLMLSYADYIDFMRCLISPINQVGDYDHNKAWQDNLEKLIYKESTTVHFTGDDIEIT